jgi:hypothetical protein
MYNAPVRTATRGRFRAGTSTRPRPFLSVSASSSRPSRSFLSLPYLLQLVLIKCTNKGRNSQGIGLADDTFSPCSWRRLGGLFSSLSPVLCVSVSRSGVVSEVPTSQINPYQEADLCLLLNQCYLTVGPRIEPHTWLLAEPEQRRSLSLSPRSASFPGRQAQSSNIDLQREPSKLILYRFPSITFSSRTLQPCFCPLPFLSQGRQAGRQAPCCPALTPRAWLRRLPKAGDAKSHSHSHTHLPKGRRVALSEEKEPCYYDDDSGHVRAKPPSDTVNATVWRKRNGVPCRDFKLLA